MSFNTDLAKVFFQIADLLEMKGEVWPPRAYRRVAFAIDSIEDVREIYKREGLTGLQKIPSVGETLAAKIEEYIKTGSIEKKDRLMKDVPKELVNIMELPGMGPKKGERLYKELGVKNVEQLKKAAEQGKIKTLSGFGEKSEKEILNAITAGFRQKDRQPYDEIYPLAKKILAEMKTWPEVIKADVGGSVRRKEPTIGDLDMVASSETPEKVTARFVNLPNVKKIIVHGKTKASVWLQNNFQADLRVVDDAIYGAAMQYSAGPKNFNIKTRKIAMKKGYKLSEYGLFDRKTGKLLAGKTEKGIFKKLGLPYLKPEGERRKFSKE
ncbi:hypothetical protein HOD83_02150 [Candidatus Woesearchaeota archaeon]|jgi:DNA polymerase (family X)|nr:hypothetical protein [Candidatus Woesearchaeota archaeon]MBT4114025.1 hypothetical protein [Candidatus Woesearchaeota archaeon]MBT4248368.1 hypothetical protein [Candidatus Woesearchaeota archaeon]